MDQTANVNSNSTGSKKGNGCWIAALILFILLIVGGLCGGLIFVVTVASSIDTNPVAVDENVIQEGGESKAAVINVEGVISQSGLTSPLTGGGVGANPAALRRDLNRALEDDSVKVIILRIESPGGEVVASDIMYKDVLEAKKSKPIVVYSSTVMASGGYYIACAANQIITHPSVTTGSIGVIMETMNVDGLYDKLGIESRAFKSGRFKDDEELFDENPTGEYDQIIQNMVDEIYGSFVKVVMDGRGMSESEVKLLADGRIYTGTQAVQNGLVDQTGYFEDAITAAAELSGEEDLTVIEYRVSDFWDTFAELRAKLKLLGTTPATQPLAIQAYYILSL